MESDEECERAHLVPDETSEEKEPQPSPQGSPVMLIGRILATPPSPTSNRVSSSGGGSFSSRTVNKLSVAPSLTPVPGGSSCSANARYLHVNQTQKLGIGNLSRRPSVLSDYSSRTQKDNLIARMNNIKRDTVVRIEQEPVVPVALTAPPNTPDPKARVTTTSTTSCTSGTSRTPPIPVDVQECQRSSSQSSSHLTTQALASDSETLHEEKGSNETLRATCVGYPAEGSSYSRVTRVGAGTTGAAAVRSVGSNAFLKSLWGHRTHQRNTQHHSFFTDTTDVRQMEHSLLQLLDDFHSGKLRAFAKEGSMEQMQGIREQQERLARVHFELGARQELYAPLSDEGLRANQENMHQLMTSLQQLSHSIEKLQCFSKDSSN